jgi:hypothetical protein
MRQTRQRQSIFAVASLGLYGLGAALAPLADARLEARAASGVVHVESDSTPACPPAHDHDSCQFCRTLRTNVGPSGQVVALASAAAQRLAAPAPARPAIRTTRVSPHHSRAPPAPLV